MHTRPIVQHSAVPSFRRRLRRVLAAMRRVAVARGQVDIPDYLREDIGLSHGRRQPRANAPPAKMLPDGNPYWRI
jgi:hypothetical protein